MEISKIEKLFSALLLPDPHDSIHGILKNSDLQWNELSRLVHHHMVASRLYRIIGGVDSLGKMKGPKNQPYSDFTDSLLRGRLFACMMHEFAEHWIPVFTNFFRGKDIPFILLKGWGLAHRIYPNPEDRAFSDFDLLFPNGSETEVLSAFSHFGFIRDTSQPRWEANKNKFDLAWEKNALIKIECHFGLGYGRHKMNEEVWNRMQSCRINTKTGGEIEFFHLHPEDEFLYLIYHAGVAHRFQKWIWIMDLVEYQRRFPKIQSTIQATPHMSLALRRCVDFFESLMNLNDRQSSARFKHYKNWIVSGSIEESTLKKIRLRAYLHGGWLSLGDYTIKHTFARFFGKYHGND